MLRLADTSIRLYRKKNGKVSLRLRSFLIVDTNAGFRLGAYLKDIRCQLTLPSGKLIKFDSVSFTEVPESKLELNTMIHGFWASAVTDMDVISNGVGTFRMDYHISFTGLSSEEPEYFETIVPLLKRKTIYK